MNGHVRTLVVGGGLAGLAVTRCLQKLGVEVLLLDENQEPAQSWRGRYDNLRLNSIRWLSHMPGQPLPRSFGRWVSRDDLVAYAVDYARPVEHLVRHGVRVSSIERQAPTGWLAMTSEGTVSADDVVLATGLYRQAVIPRWPGRADFRGRLLHAEAYTQPADFEGQRVLVVGPGVSGVDIASDLLGRSSGSLAVAVRTPPNLLPRELWSIPLQGLSVTNRYAPVAVQDFGGRLVQRLACGDLGRTPLGRSPEGMFTRLQRTGVNPAVDDGRFLPAVRSGAIEVVDEVVGLLPDGAITRSGRRVRADTVIAATGYRTGLESLLGGVGVLDARGVPPQYGPENGRWSQQGLHFVGYSSPLTGHLREIRLLARKTSRTIARRSVARREPVDQL